MSRWILVALILAVVIAVVLPDAAPKSGAKVPPEVRAQLRGHKVVMLSADWCGYCTKLKGDLRAAKVPFKVLDVEETETGRRIYRQLRLRAIPATIVDDDLVLGYDPDRVIALARD